MGQDIQCCYSEREKDSKEGKGKKDEQEQQAQDDIDYKGQKQPSQRKNDKRRRNRKPDNVRVIGIQNVGKSDYMGSFLQCLISLKEFQEYFDSDQFKSEVNHKNPDGYQGKLAITFNQFMNQIKTEDKIESISPQALRDCLSQKLPVFAPDDSNPDAFEAFNLFLNLLHEDINRPRIKPYNELPQDDPSFTDEEMGNKMWTVFRQNDNSFVTDLFYGQRLTTAKCSQCETLSRQYDDFMIQSLELTATGSSLDLLFKFQSDHVQRSELERFCYSCDGQTEVQHSIKFMKLPQILIIHLNRFKNEYHASMYQFDQFKNCELFKFPVTDFNIGPYTNDGESQLYDLCAVVNHEGKSLSDGHFTSMTKNWQNNKWYKFDDDQVEPIKYVRDEIVTDNAYILFYRKKQ